MTHFFIEHLTLQTWLFSVFPRLLYRRLAKRGRITSCYFFDSFPLGIWAAKTLGWITGVRVEKLRFRMLEVRDQEGLLVRLRIPFQDLAEAQAEAMKEAAFRACLNNGGAEDRFPIYLAKRIVSGSFLDQRSMSRVLFLVQVCVWHMQGSNGRGTHAVLFLDRRPWFDAVGRYAFHYDMTIVPVTPPYRLNARALLRQYLGPRGIELLRAVRDRRYRRGFLASTRKEKASRERGIPVSRSNISVQSSTPRVGVEYYGQLNLDQPERYSDLFFWQQSSLPGSDMSVIFALPEDPLDEKKWSQLAENGMNAIVLNPRAATIPEAPLFTASSRRAERAGSQWRIAPSPRSVEGIWLKEQAEDYQEQRMYWRELFGKNNIRIYVSWYKYDARHCAIVDALLELGGAMVIYQRAHEEFPSVETTIAADIVFGYSSGVAHKERLSNSLIPYYVTTGYLGDHRFVLVRGKAQEVRDALRQHGATHILSFFDENSADDSRWHTGHEFQRENYAFLLEKVLSEPWLGLVLKPKVPGTLRERLGPVTELLDRARATGRCYMYEGGALHGSHPPAAAALASDLAIHGHLCAGTAGVEAALAGIPTLLMDREGWPVSSLYRLGVGKVVFTDWQSLWDALTEHWTRPGGTPGFGDWSPLLDELDPFRDGHAAQRMGTYIQWLIEGFKAGRNRETVMADAAERYCAAWGRDKITEVNYPGKVEEKDNERHLQ